MTPESLVQEIDKLVSLPEVCIQVNQMMEQPNCSATKLAEIISHDVDISARLLKLVNSPFYGMRSKIDTISRAVTIAGTNELRNLVLATTAVRSFTGIPEELINMDDFWRHAVTTGVMSQMLAQHCNALHSERLFVAGMLHDVGRLAIYLTIPEKAKRVLEVTGGDDWILAETENQIIGFNHMDVGAALMRSWNLPENLISVAKYHHCPQEATDTELDVALVHIALAIARGEMAGFAVDEMLWAIEPSAWEMTGLSPETIAPFVDDMLAKALDVMGMILMPMAQKRA
ncbi:MAG: HDOD domain-containing protein [Candidatus Thiodiazotropha sp. (ex Monitilora ramsayi)]|nr:HDOD domain-containing protein [Candidatus Thiodiazotropha sp. (ex Monitilora ramsayi)]